MQQNGSKRDGLFVEINDQKYKLLFALWLFMFLLQSTNLMNERFPLRLHRNLPNWFVYTLTIAGRSFQSHRILE